MFEIEVNQVLLMRSIELINLRLVDRGIDQIILIYDQFNQPEIDCARDQLLLMRSTEIINLRLMSSIEFDRDRD